MNAKTYSNETQKTGMDVKEIALSAMFIAFVYVATAMINIRLPFAPNGGLIHLGNVPLFIAAALYGKKTGAFAGAIGMGLFDVVSGCWATWAPFTFVIVGCIGYAFGKITEKKLTPFTVVLAMITACFIKVGGYYIAEGILVGNWVTPVTSIPGNVIQIGVASVVSFPIIFALKSILRKAD